MEGRGEGEGGSRGGEGEGDCRRVKVAKGYIGKRVMAVGEGGK